MTRFHRVSAAFAAAGVVVAVHMSADAAGDPRQGEREFRACVACHSLQADRNMTGPSLASLWGRRAGGLASFSRYSPALKGAGVVWDERTLNAWLEDPKADIPGNHMLFPGIKNDQPRPARRRRRPPPRGNNRSRI
jgi:cytochrome c